MNTSPNSNKKKDENLPWWAELLFVQIGLPDKFLIKILNTKKESDELIKNEKKDYEALGFKIGMGIIAVVSIFQYGQSVLTPSPSPSLKDIKLQKYKKIPEFRQVPVPGEINVLDESLKELGVDYNDVSEINRSLNRAGWE